MAVGVRGATVGSGDSAMKWKSGTEKEKRREKKKEREKKKKKKKKGKRKGKRKEKKENSFQPSQRNLIMEKSSLDHFRS